MIGYRITLDELKLKIELHKPGWLKRAAERTETFRAAKKFNESKSIWSEIKPVYMQLQGESKCAFCERKLESVEHGTGEQAVEHFRPKGDVRQWVPSQELIDAGVVVSDVPSNAPGYYLIAYHPFNYSASCNPCNSSLKGSAFPIAGDYDFETEDPADLKNELPYLIYPIGDVDEPPEGLIEFYGPFPRPVAKRGRKKLRALVTIEFFKLGDETERKNLVRERAIVITALFPQLEKLQSGTAAEKRVARTLVNGFTSAKTAHTNCALCFQRLFETDPADARSVFERAAELVGSMS